VGIIFPGYDIFIPWWHALIALIITIVSHEFAHGILAKAQNMRIKSTGVITVGVLPIGAFVEPDDEEVKKRKSIEKMRLFSAGSFANLCMCVFAAALYLSLILLVAFSMDVNGLEIVGTTKGYPADGVIKPGTVLLEVNGKPPDIGDLFPGVSPGENVTLNTDSGAVVLRTVESPENKSKAYIGIYSVPRVVFKEELMERFPWIPANRELIGFYIKVVSFLLSALKWVMFFNFNIALVNLIPLAPFDGWHMLKELLSAFNISEASAERIAWGVLAFTAVLFLINLSPLGGRLLSTLA
jgi:membrane-associated protease RseP (regulator of RpoE activity)